MFLVVGKATDGPFEERSVVMGLTDYPCEWKLLVVIGMTDCPFEERLVVMRND